MFSNLTPRPNSKATGKEAINQWLPNFVSAVQRSGTNKKKKKKLAAPNFINYPTSADEVTNVCSITFSPVLLCLGR